jgi:hypothetical protein
MMEKFMEKIGLILITVVTKMMDNILKIITRNAKRLAKHLQEIKTFIFRQNIDI